MLATKLVAEINTWLQGVTPWHPSWAGADRGRVESLEGPFLPHPSPSHSQVFSLRRSFLASAPGWRHISPALASTISVT